MPFGIARPTPPSKGDRSLHHQRQIDRDLLSGSQDRVVHAYEQERLRLAREIHDGPAQILANAVFELEYFERLLDRNPTAIKDQLLQLKRDLRDGLAEVRRFIFDLRPPSLDEGGLFIALRRYLAEYGRHFGIKVEVSLPDTHEGLSPADEVAVFRIVQEALQNVQRHAMASRVVVKGATECGELHLQVADNGRGFDLEEISERRSRNLGLVSMRERADQLGASLEVVTSPGSGTTIYLGVPLETVPGGPRPEQLP